MGLDVLATHTVPDVVFWPVGAVLLLACLFAYVRSTGALGGNGAWPWDRDRWPR